MPLCAPAKEIAEFVRRAEALRFDVAWLPDSQLLWRDVFATLALAADRTDRIGLGIAVTNIQTRHPTVLASAANTIAEMAPSRLVVGLGTGDSSTGTIGLRPSRRDEMREAFDMMRALLAGNEWDFGPRRSRLRDAKGRIPLYMAASGPRNLALAGEIADGVILLAGIAPVALGHSLGGVRQGVSRRADGAGPEIAVGAFCRVTDNVRRDSRVLKPICLSIAQLGGQDFLQIAGIDLPNPGYVEGVYPDMVHAEDWDLATDRASEFVTDDMAIRFAETFCLFGTPEDIGRRIDAAAALGATSFYLRHVGNYTLPTELMEDFARGVLPRYADA